MQSIESIEIQVLMAHNECKMGFQYTDRKVEEKENVHKSRSLVDQAPTSPILVEDQLD